MRTRRARPTTTDPRSSVRRGGRAVALPPLAGLVALTAAAAFAILSAAYVTGDPLVSLDERIAVWIHAQLTPPITAAARAVTMFGGLAVLVAVTCLAAAYLAIRGRHRAAALMVVTVAGAQVVTFLLKALFGRERPSFDDPVATAASFSFPSGHSSGSLAVYGALAYLIWPALRSSRQRAALAAATVTLIAAIGFSRLYLGVHYLSDILAGWSFGLAWLLLAVALVHVHWHAPTRGDRATPFSPRKRRSLTRRKSSLGSARQWPGPL